MTTDKLHINEIYTSLQGEGIRSGYPTIFIRTQGCSLRCSWCDTPYGLPFSEDAERIGEGQYLTVDEVLLQVYEKGKLFRDICLTGGDPLQQKWEPLKKLILELAKENYYIVVETGGHIPTGTFITEMEGRGFGNQISFCVDYKLNKSGMTSKMKSWAFYPLRQRDSVKYVVADMEDWEQAIAHLKGMRQTTKTPFTALFSPVWEGSLGIKGLAEQILSAPPELQPLQLSLQIHKVIWDPGTRKT